MPRANSPLAKHHARLRATRMALAVASTLDPSPDSMARSLELANNTAAALALDPTIRPAVAAFEAIKVRMAAPTTYGWVGVELSDGEVARLAEAMAAAWVARAEEENDDAAE